MDIQDVANKMIVFYKTSSVVAVLLIFLGVIFEYKKLYDFFCFFTEYKLRKLRQYGEEYLKIEDNSNDSIEKVFIKKQKKELLVRLLTGIINSDKSKIYMYLKVYGKKNSRGLKNFVDHIHKKEGKWVLKRTNYKIWRFIFTAIGRTFLIGMCFCLYFSFVKMFNNNNDPIIIVFLLTAFVLEFIGLYFETKLPGKKRAMEYEKIIDRVNMI